VHTHALEPTDCTTDGTTDLEGQVHVLGARALRLGARGIEPRHELSRLCQHQQQRRDGRAAGRARGAELRGRGRGRQAYRGSGMAQEGASRSPGERGTAQGLQHTSKLSRRFFAVHSLTDTTIASRKWWVSPSGVK
jgi:hypothetical protein